MKNMSNMTDDLEKILLTETQLAAKVKEIGAAITADYAGKEILMIGVLRGAFIFMGDLVRAINLPVAVDFIALSSYGASASSSGVVRILKDLEENIENKHVLIVEDIIDSGLTIKYLIENLASRKPASIKICTLMSKPDRRKIEVPITYNGFTIPDYFVVGYGLDYAEKYRNLPFIGVLKPEIYEV